MHVEILGPDCHDCLMLEHAALQALALAGLQADVTRVTDCRTIAAYGVVQRPALVIDGRVMGTGRIPLVGGVGGCPPG